MMWDVEGAVANRAVAGSNGSSNDDGIKWGGRRWLVPAGALRNAHPKADPTTPTPSPYTRDK